MGNSIATLSLQAKPIASGNTKLVLAGDSRTVWLVALGLMVAQFLPQLLLWDEAYIRIHDTLEGIDYQNLFAAGKTFDYSAGAKIEQVMNGLPRAAVKTGWSFIAFWHWLFGLYWGYVFNYMLVHLAAFSGMYFLLRKTVLPDPKHTWLALGVALCYGWLPVFTMLGMSVAGLPWVVWAFLKLQSNISQKLPAWLVLLLFPFYSDLVWAGVPTLAFGGLFWLRNALKNKQLSLHLLSAIGLMALLYMGVNWQLFQLTFWPGDFISHRAEYDYFYNKALNPWHSLKESGLVLLLCHHHVGVFVSVPILLAVGVVGRRFGLNRTASAISSLLLVFSLFYGFYNFVVWMGEGHFELLKSYKFERAIILLPILWLLLFATVLKPLAAWNKRLAMAFLAAQFAICIFAQDEFTQNLRQLAGHPRKPNFQAFFDERLFAEIDHHIGLPKESYRVVSLGMHPSSAQYNGFYTLDRHASLYDLRYKHQFREIMADELAKSTIVQKEFDQFGNRCYLYSAELGKDFDAFLCGKQLQRSVCHLALNAEALCGMGSCFLFSAVEVKNAEEIGLRLDGVFEGRFWRVHLYKVEGGLVAQNHFL